MAKNVETSSISQPAATPGPFLAKVVGHLDPNYMGGLEVEILRPVGGTNSEGQLHQVKYMSPFYGVTGFDYTRKDSDTFSDTQKSYGMWMIPPDPGTTVIIIFIDGDPKRGFWIGCVQDEHMNFMVPGMAGTERVLDADGFLDGKTSKRLPVAEYNKKNNNSTGDTTQNKKPSHPFAKILINSGLDVDDIRGTTTSSARRETPSAVFGISTPGPLDKGSGAAKGTIGKKEHAIKNTYVSRLGGSTFVMDDGDDKFLRKKKASEAGPEYVSPEQDEKDGNVNIPHNELVRIRTRSGHQILLHNSEDLIYISHGSGNSWIEMTANGKIDVYAKDSISFHTENDFNFIADRDINFQAAGSINLTAGANFNCTAMANYEIRAGADGKLMCGGTSNIKAGGNHVESAAQIHMNGPAAASAVPAFLPVRVPSVEPWAGHENLDPTMFTKDKTKAVANADDPPKNPPTLVVQPKEGQEPTMWKKYTTSTDTFKKIKGSS